MAFRRLAALALCAAAGCDGGDDPITVRFDPPEVAVVAQAGRTGEQTVTATATFSRPLPSGALVGVLAPAADLDPASLQVRAGAQRTQLTVSLRVLSGLPAGTHQGTIALELGSDSPSANRHSRVDGELRYSVAVTAP